MDRVLVSAVVAALALQIIAATQVMCPNDPNCVCGGTLSVELNCNIDGRIVKINLLPNTYINIKCENTTSFDYSKLPKCANQMNTFKSVSFKDCPLPSSSFKDVLTSMGVSKTMALIFQNAKNLSGYFDRRHFAGLEDLTKLLLSINGITHLPDNLFMDISKLTWLNIRSNSINLSEELFKPLEKLETLEISHNHMTNISSNLFSHLSYLRKLSLWQSNVTWFSKDLFTGVDVLEELDLSSNGLNELPSSIFKPLRKLKKLTLFSNKFSSLPLNLFKHNEELETVAILNNDVKLKELPKYLFGGLNNLKEIYIQRSGLENLPYDVFANSAQITNISLAYNDIKMLPESVFNDQINLLELNLSHNMLNSLEPKLFSSLVRLESLNLNYNRLVKISGSTFSSLFSLIYLNMEHNDLKTISNKFFSNNRQKMIISLAYNKLRFEDKELINNSWIQRSVSPFSHTYNLRLLNLSHNEFRTCFKDWWINGHDNLDIRYNYIEKLWPEFNRNQTYRNLVKKPVKKVWIANNPVTCECKNYLFLNFLEVEAKTKIMDEHLLLCPLWAKEACCLRFTVIVSLVITVVCLYMLMVIIFIIYRKKISGFFKKNMHQFSEQHYNKLGLIFTYDAKDKDFVVEEFLPGLRNYNQTILNQTELGKSLINTPTSNDKLKKKLKKVPKQVNVVIFSPNYLMSFYRHVSIKKILSKMMRKKNTIYVYLDSEPDNSVYAFLKQHRDKKNGVIWNEYNFWDKFLAIMNLDKATYGLLGPIPYKELVYMHKIHGDGIVTSPDISHSQLQNGHNIYYNSDKLTHSKV